MIIWIQQTTLRMNTFKEILDKTFKNESHRKVRVARVLVCLRTKQPLLSIFIMWHQVKGTEPGRFKYSSKYVCRLIKDTVRPWDARFLGNGKTRVAQNLCNLSYLIRKKARASKNRAANKGFTTNISCISNFFEPH